MYTDELLERFDAGEEVLDYFDVESIEHPNLDAKVMQSFESSERE